MVAGAFHPSGLGAPNTRGIAGGAGSAMPDLPQRPREEGGAGAQMILRQVEEIRRVLPGHLLHLIFRQACEVVRNLAS